jgi:hypothetical protein
LAAIYDLIVLDQQIVSILGCFRSQEGGPQILIFQLGTEIRKGLKIIGMLIIGSGNHKEEPHRLIIKGLEIIPVEHMDEVIDLALFPPKPPETTPAPRRRKRKTEKTEQEADSSS